MSKGTYNECLEYIDSYWEKITCYTPVDQETHIGLPNQFISPNDDLFKDDFFYWDSYFTMIGLVESGRVEIAKNIVDNFVQLYHRFSIVPLRNRFYNVGISQPPFLTSMILEVFDKTKDAVWLKEVSKTAENELKNYWIGKKSAKKHLVFHGLSRYCDHFVTHLTAEHESGWDMTSRFGNRCLNYLPVDLNSCLYKYETDLAKIHKILKNSKKSEYFKAQAEKRKKAMNDLMWDDKRGFFFDYNYKYEKRSDFVSAAGFYPLWAGIASKSQAKKIAENLNLLEGDGGIANTQSAGLSEEFKQWDYPNGWANQQWIAVKGLLNYGFNEEGKRIAKKWLDMNKKVFEKTGFFWEKYDVVKADVGKEGRYPNQRGFGWTNAVFVKFVSQFFK